jgi:hypothetical protein
MLPNSGLRSLQSTEQWSETEHYILQSQSFFRSTFLSFLQSTYLCYIVDCSDLSLSNLSMLDRHKIAALLRLLQELELSELCKNVFMPLFTQFLQRPMLVRILTSLGGETHRAQG